MATDAASAPEVTGSAAVHLPDRRDLDSLRTCAAGCRGCPLWHDATQTVFGDGATDARVMFVGEQPGDREDQEGEPFVGPAGRLLDKAMDQAGIDRDAVYVTNAVKHFKFEQRGKRRIHQKPNRNEVEACKPWLLAEMEAVEPDLVVALGATAAQSLLGASFRVTRQRGELHLLDDRQPVTATVHPSSILRAPDDETRHRELDRFVADLAGAMERVTD